MMRSTEQSYCNVRRYSAGVMPVARRNARVKLDCEENWQLKAISESDARPVAIIVLAHSSRRRLT
jgi:hypothetical protein